jgi:hypothetical protein
MEQNSSCVIICKYLFESQLLIQYLKEENCAVMTGRRQQRRNKDLVLFKNKQKKYLISTLSMSQSNLKHIEGTFDVVFFSLSFKLNEYQSCISYLENNTQRYSVRVKRFFTNAGIDRKIKESLELKGDLASEIKSRFRDKTGLRQFVEML